jgi:hypothetical protein
MTSAAAAKQETRPGLAPFSLKDRLYRSASRRAPHRRECCRPLRIAGYFRSSLLEVVGEALDLLVAAVLGEAGDDIAN